MMNDDLRNRVHEAVQGELHLLAAELGVKPYGAEFAETVRKITHAIEHALDSGDESFKNVQGVIDRYRALASNPRRKLNYDIKNAARNISRLRRSSPQPRLGSEELE